MEKEDVSVTIARLEERLDFFLKETADYRSIVRDDLAELKTGVVKIAESVFNLPCKERKSWYQSMNRQITFIWGIICAICYMGASHILGWNNK